MPHFKGKCVEHNKEGLFAKKECKEQGPKGRLSKFREKGERQLRRAIKRFREKEGNYSSKLENARSLDYFQDVSARRVSHFLNFLRYYSGMLRHGSTPNLHNLAKWHLQGIVLISRHETWKTGLARWP